MPVRVRAKPPGEFMRDHMVAAGGIDYPQSMYRAYKTYLKAQGLRDGCSRASWSKYIWLANKMGLITFDHAEAPAYWNAIENGVEVPVAYTRESRPQAPSPRHYYRIVNPTDSRWIRLEASYRESIGIEVPPAFPRVPIKAAPPPVKKPPKAKLPKPAPAKPPRVVKPKPPTAEEKVQPYEERIGLILAALSELETAPTLEKVAEIEDGLIILGEDVLEVAEKARGREKTLLSNIAVRWRTAIEEMPLLRSSVQRVQAAETKTERARAEAALRAAVRVVAEDLSILPPEERGEKRECQTQLIS